MVSLVLWDLFLFIFSWTAWFVGPPNFHLTSHFYWNWTFEINPTDSIFLASNIQIFIVVYLHINSNIPTDVKYLWLLLSLCSLSYYSSLLVWRFYNRVYGQFPPHFTLVINRLKLQFDQSLSITLLVILLWIQPIRLDWSPSLPGSFTVLRVVMSPK